MSRYLILATTLVIAGFYLTLRSQTSIFNEPQADERNQTAHSTTESTDQFATTPRTKSKNRIHHPKPTIEETEELLKATIIPRVDIQDQSILEIAAVITTFIKDAGIPPHQLRVIVHKSDDLLRWRIRELRIRNIPLHILLKYICDSTRLHCRVEPGIICFFDVADAAEFPEIEESSAPSEVLPDPDDPFAGSPTQGADPFAEPEIPTSP